MKRLLLLDNFDSFTFNLVHYLEGLGANVDVYRNNDSGVNPSDYDGIVISPGPGLPQDAGCLMRLLGEVEGRKPVLGVCLGMQAIAVHLGGGLYNQKKVKHGVKEIIHVKDSVLFNGLEKVIEVGLYHSWAVDDQGNYEIDAVSENGVNMALSNSEKKMYGVQFHPESIMTTQGKKILRNYLRML